MLPLHEYGVVARSCGLSFTLITAICAPIGAGRPHVEPLESGVYAFGASRARSRGLGAGHDGRMQRWNGYARGVDSRPRAACESARVRLIAKGSSMDRRRHYWRHRIRQWWAVPGPITQALERFAVGRREVIFVQVGSNDGKSGDPIHHLVQRHGWSGVLVEPVPYLVERLRRTYRGNDRVVIEPCAIDVDERLRDFFYVDQAHPMAKWYSQLGSFDRDHIMRLVKDDSGGLIVKKQVECLTLGTLVRRHSLPRVDLLHIDAEGHDYAIIQSIDFKVIRPAFILFESGHLCETDGLACRALLAREGYSLIEEGRDTAAILGTHVPMTANDR